MASYSKFKFKVRQCQAKKKAASDVVSSQLVNINVTRAKTLRNVQKSAETLSDQKTWW